MTTRREIDCLNKAKVTGVNYNSDYQITIHAEDCYFILNAEMGQKRGVGPVIHVAMFEKPVPLKVVRRSADIIPFTGRELPEANK